MPINVYMCTPMYRPIYVPILSSLHCTFVNIRHMYSLNRGINASSLGIPDLPGRIYIAPFLRIKFPQTAISYRPELFLA